MFFPFVKVTGQPNCAAVTSGFTPINDLGKGTFTNAWNVVWQGGLYPNGSNFLPAGHKSAGIQMASQIQYLNNNGNPDAVNGKIVWLSIGMSNGTQEAQQFIPIVNSYKGKNQKLTLVDGAVGGQTAAIISTPANSNYTTYWNTVNTRLTNSGVSAYQVQVVWIKEADVANAQPIKNYYDSLVVRLKRAVREIKVRFPNVKLCYFASRISARYASSALNPEPYSYYTGWAIKKVIEDQINGDLQLAYSGTNTKSPWLSWGIYLWSDGDIPQKTNPNVFWSCPNDFQSDGTHPSVDGAKKVGNLLLDFFSNDSIASKWINASGKPLAVVEKTSLPANEMMIYPNPSSGQLTIQCSHEIINGKLFLFDALGRSIFQVDKLNGIQIILDKLDFPKGLYFLKLLSDGEYYSLQKILIK